MAVDLHQIGPAVVVVIDESAAPRYIVAIGSNSRGKRHTDKSPVLVVVVEIAGIVGKIRLKNVKPPVTVIIGDSHAHASLLVTVLAIGAARGHTNVSECPVVIVAEKNARLRVDRNVDIGPTVVVEVV